ncbi:MAG: hypothetical protein HWE13_06055 [Gammaproteobacteria bacterium]|nr:hypothetical protein [Gammaproteobacteria bacterium]NVK87667.1 hypothetical protein [Gammaproteobacteria bacterium]
MKLFAIVLVAMSFLGGAFLASLDAKTLNWYWFIPTIVLGFIGAIMLKRVEHVTAKHHAHQSGSIDTLKRCLQNIVDNLNDMNAKKDQLPTYEARFEIDRVFREDLAQFADARESMRHVFGLKEYADIMSAFAAGERYINRVWSASTDGYIDEVKQYIERASLQFNEAAKLFNAHLEDANHS